MQPHQREFIDLCLQLNALEFGEFTLKSGRISPYFFNAGHFCTGVALRQLGHYYLAALDQSGVAYDMLFGPAYKGIPLAAAIALAAAENGRDLPYAYNRKEAKDHGEGGVVVGFALTGRVLIVDDVISAGTSARESARLIEQSGASLAGLAIALDRQEKGSGERSAVCEVEQDLGVPVVSIANLDTLIEYLTHDLQDDAVRRQMSAYRTRYGVSG